MHLLGAGERDRAATFAERAADEAAAKLAFGQAERLLRMTMDAALARGPEVARSRMRWASPRVGGPRRRRGARLPRRGRADRALERRSGPARGGRAAPQLGPRRRRDGGAAPVLAAVGLQAPRSPPAAPLLAVVYRALGSDPGTATERDAASVPPDDVRGSTRSSGRHGLQHRRRHPRRLHAGAARGHGAPHRRPLSGPARAQPGDLAPGERRRAGTQARTAAGQLATGSWPASTPTRRVRGTRAGTP